ncbi:putative RNA-directed DNA polymerase from transposon BS [Caerostris darwini]|uniref:RNA-directed DNA polymerase from transposon BS n=1 Tax=Caerostris darwini TaxID=1538125 RepID=A0AAV4SKW2_9ARAC|nr:putative RNA-directed DNA polymerase from transposon BS [Caerostris darwini]
MDQLHLNVRNTASSVALDKQGRERDLGRGFPWKKLQSPPKCRKIRKLRILQFNINGLFTPSSRIKLDKILELASKHQVSIIALQETQLTTRHRLRVKGYNIVRQDRSSNGCGGLMFLIRDVYFQGIDRINSPRKKGAVPRGKHKKKRPAFTRDSQHLQTLLAKREHLLQSHNLNDNTDARIELNKINAEIKREYCSINQGNWQDLCKSLDYKTPNTRLWRLAKKLDKIQPQVENTNSIIGINGVPTVNDKEAADALGNCYSEESKLALGRENKKTGRTTRKLIRSCRVIASNELFNDPITSSELLYAIQQLDFKKSPRPDGIHGQFIVNLGSCAN